MSNNLFHGSTDAPDHIHSSYQNSEQHIENARRASEIALSCLEECVHCSEKIVRSSIKRHEKACIKNPSNYRECPNCSTQLTDRRVKYCSKSCSATFSGKKRKQSASTKQKVSATLCQRYASGQITAKKGYFGRNTTCRIQFRNCENCEKLFCLQGWSLEGRRKTCSVDCHYSLVAKKFNPFQCLSIPFEHNGETIYLQSNWEIAIAKYLNQAGISWIRPASIPWIDSSGKPHRYYPDFYLTAYNLYLDPKNSYVQEKDKEKLEAVTTTIELLVGSPAEIIQQLECRIGLK
jgi:hypothetical protein